MGLIGKQFPKQHVQDQALTYHGLFYRPLQDGDRVQLRVEGVGKDLTQSIERSLKHD